MVNCRTRLDTRFTSKAVLGITLEASSRSWLDIIRLTSTRRNAVGTDFRFVDDETGPSQGRRPAQRCGYPVFGNIRLLTLPPASRYRLIIVSETESSTLEPNSAVPRQSTEASRLVRGTNRVLIGYFFFAFFEGLRVFQIQPVSYRFPVLFRRDWLCHIPH